MSAPAAFTPDTGNSPSFLHTAKKYFSVVVLGLVLLCGIGIFFGLPNPALHLPLLVLLYPGCLYALARQAPTARAALLRGWWAGLAANIAGLYWMVFPMHDVAGFPFALAGVAALLLFAGLACYAALAAFSFWNLHRIFAETRTFVRLLPPLLGGLAFAGFEVLCAFILTGFPWLSLGSALGFSPLWMQAASLFGGFGLTAVLAVSACLMVEGIFAPPKKNRIFFGLSVALLVALPLFGLHRLTTQPLNVGATELSLIMVQGNIDQNQKWLPAFQKNTLDHYVRLSREALQNYRADHEGNSPDLLLWPETAMPFYFDRHPDYSNTLLRFASEENVNLALGSLGLEKRTDGDAALKNRFYLLSPKDGRAGFYDKRHLVPFGEYTPFAVDIPMLRDLLQGLDFSPGTVTEPLRLKKDGAIYSLGVLICYEAIFPALAQERVNMGANVLVNVSNDGWFRDSSAPRQHLAHVVLRAVEQNRPVLRATNTGFTTVIDSYGTLIEQAPALFSEGTLSATVTPSRQTTIYHRLRPLPEGTLVALALLSLLGYYKRPVISGSLNKH